MKRCMLVVLGLFLIFAPLEAQEPAVPTHSVVRFFQCSDAAEAIRRFNRARPVVDAMVAEGKFVAYGILSHAWGDEWNVVDYFTISGLDGFFTNFAELGRRVNERNAADPAVQAEDNARPFREVCEAHKDVIYAIVNPPTGS